MTPDAVLVDGREGTQLSVLDRGLHYGDGLFETIACQRGRARFLSLHLNRLVQGCARLSIPAPAMQCLRAEIEQLVPSSGPALIKLIVTRGRASRRGYGPAGDEHPARVLLRYPASPDDPSLMRDGIVARFGRLRLGENPALAGIKHLNRLEQVLARVESDPSGALETLLFSSSGRLISGTMSNVFVVRDNEVATPRLDRCGVEGVMRRVLMRTATEAGLPVEEMRLTQTDLDSAQEVFLTNARIGIWPVRAIQARSLTPGPLTRRLQELMRPLLEARG